MNYNKLGGNVGNFKFVKYEEINADISLTEDGTYEITLNQINSFSGIFVFNFVLIDQENNQEFTEFTATASIYTEGSSIFTYRTKNIRIFFTTNGFIEPKDINYDRKSITFDVSPDFYTTDGGLMSLPSTDTPILYVYRVYF